MADYKRVRVARRTVMYIVTTLLLVTVAAILCVAAFMTCERLSNLYILSTEGLAMRADCILQDGARNDLEEYFTTAFLESDEPLNGHTYDSYTVSSYDYDLAIERIQVLPWSTTATVTVVETVTLKGSINTDKLSEGESAADYPPPRWPTARYRIQFINTGMRWFINGLELVTLEPETEPLNTPDPALTPRPMATATPSPTAAP